MNGVGRRLLVALLGVVAASVFVFAMLRILPGDIATARLGTDATPAALDELRRDYGLDRSIPRQYSDWMLDAARGDLGRSLVDGGDVRSAIVARLDVTVPLVLASSLISVVVAVWIGRRTALHRRHLSSVLVGSLSQLGLAIPTFVLGIAIVSVFAVRWRLLPAGGFPVDGWVNPFDAFRSMLLPVITLSLTQVSMLVRFARSQSLDYVASDAFRTARAVGRTAEHAMSPALRLVLSPVLTVTALQVSTLLTGAVVVESVFALPGLGSMLVRDIANRDVTKVQSTILVIIVAVFVIRLIVDFLNDRLDPRRLA
jgi:peptide/nickel transport system permease protein